MPRYFCLPIIRFAIFTLAKRKTFGSTWKPGLDADATHGPQRLHAHFAQWKHLPKFKRHESFDPGVPPEICIRGHPTHEGRDMTSTQGCFHSRVPRSRLAVRQQGTGQISYSPSVHGVRKQPPEQNQEMRFPLTRVTARKGLSSVSRRPSLCIRKKDIHISLCHMHEMSPRGQTLVTRAACKQGRGVDSGCSGTNTVHLSAVGELLYTEP